MQVADDHSHPVWQVVVAICGVGYFAAWSYSFYPQLILNYQRKRYVHATSAFVFLPVSSNDSLHQGILAGQTLLGPRADGVMQDDRPLARLCVHQPSRLPRPRPMELGGLLLACRPTRIPIKT